MFKNPLFMASLFLISCAMAVYYAGPRAFWNSFKWVSLIGIGVLLLNVLLVHRGQTVLMYIFRNPVTLEAVIYGVYNMLMISALIISFVSFNVLLDSGRFLYLFSWILPRTSFIFDMTLRYIPLFRRRATELSSVYSVNRAKSGTKAVDKIKVAGTQLKALTAWTLEEGMDTALSLKTKNYGAKDRVLYVRYRLTVKDIVMLVLLLFCILYIYIANYTQDIGFSFYPVTDSMKLHGDMLAIYIVAVSVSACPLILESIVLIKRGIKRIWQKKH
jgi:energy-coupling factor transport system permease protein